MSIIAVDNSSSLSWLTDSCVCAPFVYVAQKVREFAQSLFGYLIRIIVFQLGEMKVKGAYTVMRFYQGLCSYDPREEKPIDFERLEKSKNFLLQYGGKESIAKTKDGEEIHLITFKSKDFFKALADQGCTEYKTQGPNNESDHLLLNPPDGFAEKFYFRTFNDFEINGKKQKIVVLPKPCPSKNPPHIIHFHSPGRSMSMDRKFVGLHLAAGYDITISDPRGTVDSTGTPSEGGFYLDAEAVYDTVVKNENLTADRTYVSGFCKGASQATHLKKLHHDKGVHFIASNPYTNIKEVVEGYGWLGRLGAHYGIDALKDPNLTIEQDYFDNVKKLENLKHSEGKCVFIHTDTDTMMPRGTVSKMIKAFGDAGIAHEILRIHPNPKENGHLQPPHEDPDVWDRYVKFVI